MSLLTIKCKNKKYTFINCHAPINDDNKENPNKVDEFWDLLDDEISKIPQSNVVILLGDFNAQIGREKIYRPIVGEYAAHQRTNKNGMRLITLCKTFQLKLMSTFLKKRPRKARTWISPNPMLGEFQLDHVAISKRNMKEIVNVKVVRNREFDSGHYLSKIKLKFLPYKNHRRGERVKRYNTDKLQITPEILQTFQEEIKITPCGKWQELSKEITNAAQETFG